MKIASLNVNSLLLHIDEIRTLVKDLGVHILAINETKLDDNIDDALVSIVGYSIKRRDRNRHGGGVAIYTNDSIVDKCSIRADLPKSSIESLCLEVKSVRAAPFLVFACYRPPNECADIFRQLEETLQVLDSENKEIILLGDSNCDILPNCEDGGRLNRVLPAHLMHILELNDLFGFQQLIKKGTRETLESTTLIDHIATTNKSNIVTSGVHETSISDHYMVYCVRKFRGAFKRKHKIITTRQLKHFDQAEFINDLSLVDWQSIVSNGDDIDLIVEQWTNMISLILEKHAPVGNRRVSEKFSPWLTNDFKQLSATRDRLKKLAVRSKSKILMETYRQTRNKVNKLNTDLKCELFTNKIASQKGDVRNTWKTINTVVNKKSKPTQISIAALQVDGRQVYDNDSIAESMNRFFCSIGNTLSDKIPKTSNPLLENEYSVNPQNLRFKFEAINRSQLERVFGNFKTSKGSCPDGIANYFLKIGLPVIAVSLCDMFNLTIATGVFPNSWKIAKVAPICKSGQSNDRSNYRPISVQPFLSRTFKKLVYNHLYDYLDKTRLLFPNSLGLDRCTQSSAVC